MHTFTITARGSSLARLRIASADQVDLPFLAFNARQLETETADPFKSGSCYLVARVCRQRPQFEANLNAAASVE
jgi:hypothetical protein